MAAIVLTLNGVDRTGAVGLESLVIRDTLRARGSTCEFRYRSAAGTPPRPEGGNEVVLTVGGTREFAGHLLVPSFSLWRDEAGLAAYDFGCQCGDYGWQLDKFLVYDRDSGSSKSYASQAAGTTVANLITTFTDGQFTTTGVETGLTAQAQEFDVVPVSECLDLLARETGYIWRVDYDRDLKFFALATNQAPIDLLDLDAEARVYAVEGDNGDVAQVKNPLLLKDAQVRDGTTLSETEYLDGVKRFLPLSYPPSPATADVAVAINGNAWQMRFDDQGGSPTDGVTASGTAYLCVWNRGVRLGSAPPSGSTALVTYNRMMPRLVWYSDPAAIAEMALREANPRGEHEAALNATQLSASSTDQVEAYARLAILQYARPRVRLSFRTQVTGWQSGQYLQVVSAGLNINRRLYVTEVTKRIINDAGLEYEVHLTDQLHGDT